MFPSKAFQSPALWARKPVWRIIFQPKIFLVEMTASKLLFLTISQPMFIWDATIPSQHHDAWGNGYFEHRLHWALLLHMSSARQMIDVLPGGNCKALNKNTIFKSISQQSVSESGCVSQEAGVAYNISQPKIFSVEMTASKLLFLTISQLIFI